MPLGRIAGIPLSLHWSFLILVALIALYGAQAGSGGVVSALFWLVVIFASVVVHELAHSLLARVKGAEVHAIVLLPIGGVSQIERMPEAWSDELAIAAVGPLTSVGLGVLAAVATLASGGHLFPFNLYGGSFLARVAWLNLVLGAFNLLPAFPLDGGRVLRATLERRRSLESATHIAATVGRVLGAAMIAVGVVWDLWLLVIGAFVYFGATQEERSTAVHSRLRGVQVGQFMRSPVRTLDAREPLHTVGGWWGVPQVVTVDGRYFGMVDAATLRRAASDPESATRTVGDVTDVDAPTLAVHDDLGRSALDRLMGSGYEALAVVDAGAVVGVILRDDIAAWFGAGARA